MTTAPVSADPHDELRTLVVSAFRRNGRSIAATSREAGVNPYNVYPYLRGSKGISVRTLARLMRTLNLEVRPATRRRAQMPGRLCRRRGR